MPNRRIFVSCGQLTSEENSLSEELINVIDKNGMKGFSAEETHQPADLNTFLFKEIQRCDGLVAVMQKRGEIMYLTYPLTQRSSVWIQQEIAILFYRSFLVGKPIPVRVYIEKGVLREGLMNFSIINPIQFTAKETILEDLPRWLQGPEFEKQPILTRRENIFQNRIKDLQEEDWLILELIAAHSPEAGGDVPIVQIAMDFQALQTGKEFDNHLNRMPPTGLVNVNRKEMIVCIRKPWWDLIVEELRNRARGV